MAIDNHDLADLIKAVYGELEKKFTKVDAELSEIKKLINEPVPMGTIDRRKAEVVTKRMEAPQQPQRQVRSPFPQIVRKQKPVQQPQQEEEDDDDELEDFELEDDDEDDDRSQQKRKSEDSEEIQI